MMRSEPTSSVTTRSYGAIRTVVSRLLRIPLDAPTLPTSAGDLIDCFHPAPAWIRVRQLQVLLIAGLGILSLVGSMVALHLIEPQSHKDFSEENSFLFWGTLRSFDLTLQLIGFLVILVTATVKLMTIRLQYDCTWYVLTTRALRIRQGLWVINETTITHANIQNVTVRQGPLERLFGLSSIEVETAGGGGAAGGSKKKSSDGSGHSGRIDGILDPTVLRERIMDQVRATRTAGLGDESPRGTVAPVDPTEGGEVDLGRMAEVLREIRADLGPARG